MNRLLAGMRTFEQHGEHGAGTPKKDEESIAITSAEVLHFTQIIGYRIMPLVLVWGRVAAIMVKRAIQMQVLLPLLLLIKLRGQRCSLKAGRTVP